MNSYCIGFLGADWWGSDARALAAQFRGMDNLVLERHYEDHLPTKWRHPLLKATRRLLRPLMESDYNRAVKELLEVDGMDFLLVFKGMLLQPETLRSFKKKGVPCYCFYPDVSYHDHGSNIPASLPIYDAVFTSKSYHVDDPALQGTVRHIQFAPHGFDPEVHRPVNARQGGLEAYRCDVSFVGHWSPKKEEALAKLSAGIPDIDLKIWGPGWQRARAQAIAHWQGRGAYGDELAAIYSLSKINLGLLSEAGTGVQAGDATTARSWQIPGSGGFLLHEDTHEIRAAFNADSEIALFMNHEEMVLQVRRYLGDESLRARVAVAGKTRADSEPYTYRRAADLIVNYHAVGVAAR